MKIKTVAIIGAGAIGSYFIAGLTEKLGDDLWIVAEGERKERLEKNGIVINDQKYDLHVKTPEEAKGVDLLIISVKYGALQGTLPMIEKIVDAHTLVISPMNGVDSEKVIGEKIGMEHMLPSFMKIASRRIDNQIVYDPEVTMGLYFGEDNGEPSERTEAIEDLLRDTPIHHHLCANIQQDIWYKYALNISKNLPQAIINCGLGAYTDSEHLAYISARMRKEVSDVAAALGIDISDTSEARQRMPLSHRTVDFHPADLDAKRPTEIDMFSGTLIRMGKELHVDTPFNEFAYHAIKCLEEKNSGKIR